MKYRIFSSLMALFGLLLLALPVLAHHSFQAEFSLEKPVALTGTLTKVDWINPHAQIYLDVKDASGKVIPWRIATWDPFVLRHAGLLRTTFVMGQTVTLTAYGAKDGSNVGYLRHIKFPDAQEFDLWDSTSNEAIQREKKAASAGGSQ